ncbi:MAG: winged-helix domain-containing protein [Candidatus Freyarchaeota archaeon]
MVESIEVLHKLYTGLKSTRKIAKSLRVRHSYVYRLLKKLEEKGLVEKDGFKGFRLTEEGKALVERERIGSPITVEKFIERIQSIAKLIATVKDPEVVKRARIYGLRYALDGTFIFIGQIIQELSEKIEPGNMKGLLDEKYDSTLKILLASVSVFCIGLGKTGWNMFHKEMIDLILRLQGCGKELERLFKS